MILVTGATGLVGSHILYHLLQTEHKVRAIHRKESNLKRVVEIFSYYTTNPEDLFNKIEWVETDLLDICNLEEAFNGVEKVYHAAAFISFKSAKEEEMKRINIEGTANIVNLCLIKGIKKLLHISSIATLGGRTDALKITEEDLWNPEEDNSGYAISKNGGEMEVWRGIEEGVNAVIVNPSIIIGPGNWSSGSGLMFSSIKEGLKFYTEGATGFVGVNDVVKVSIQLMNSDISRERFILNSENLPYKEVFGLIAEGLGAKAPSVKAGKLSLSIASMFELAKSKILNKEPRVTTDSARSSMTVKSFSADKIKNTLNFEFTKMVDVIADTAEKFMR